MSDELFPAFVRHHVTDDVRGLASMVTGRVPPAIERATVARREQFVAGRACARAALGQLAPELAVVTIDIGTAREPLWPPGIVGAITHTATRAAAAVAWSRDASGVGLDIEDRIGDDAVASVRDQVVTARELSELSATVSWELPWLLTAAFSAKESLYKALYPRVQTYFGFLDAGVVAVDEAAGIVVVRLTRPVADVPAGFEVRARYVRDASTITTALWIPP